MAAEPAGTGRPVTIGLKPSRFNLRTREPGGALLVYNSFSGAFLRFTGDAAEQVASLLAGRRPAPAGALAAHLFEQGLLVPAGTDELERARVLHELSLSRHDTLHLILMPTEQCNFRCVYCYEDFVKGKMPAEVVQGVIRLVEREAPRLTGLSVSWFGGEPLSAFDVVEEISHALLAICDRNGIRYTSSATTNAYLLTPDRATRSLAAGISAYQITLDGPPETHDTLRVLANGGRTFDTIMDNLLALRRRDDDYQVRLRVNFTPEVAQRMPSFLGYLGDRFGGDSRFSIAFHPVGHWGGPHDEQVEVCGERSGESSGISFMDQAQADGFSAEAWQEAMQPYGSVCYAANPRSFVIGSDGTVYKCTVAFRDPQNQVGKLTPDGDLGLSAELMHLWTETGEETDAGCQACRFRPPCQGNVCPLERIRRDGERVCPPIKKNIGPVLRVLASGAARAERVGLDA